MLYLRLLVRGDFIAVPFENRNFHKEMLKLAGQLQKEGKVPRLLLHSCCAPCSSNCIEVLSKYFMVTVFYYNPNITEEAEYKKRVAEQARLISELDTVIRFSSWQEHMTHSAFMRSQKEWSRWTRAVSAALPVIGCV